MSTRPAALALAILLAGAAVFVPGLAPQGTSVTDTFSAAGVRVVHRGGLASDVVTVRLYLLGGAQHLLDSPDGIESVWLTAARMAVEQDLSAAGAAPSLAASPDWSVTGFTALTKYWQEAWAPWAEALTHPAVWGGAFERARQDHLAGARRRRADAEASAKDIAWRRAFHGHPYEHDMLGTEESLAGLTIDTATDFVGRSLVTSRLLLVVVGDVPRAEIVAAVQAAFGELPHGTFAWAPPLDVEGHDNQMEIQDRPLATSYIVGQVIGPRPGTRDYLAFELATQLLSSRLHSVIRGEESLSYGAYAGFNRHAIPSATIQVTTAYPRAAYPLILKQMEWLQTVREFRQGDLGFYLDQFVLEELSRVLDPESLADDLAWATVCLGEPNLADQRIEALRRVTPRDIQRAALEYFPRFQFAFVGDATLLR